MRNHFSSVIDGVISDGFVAAFVIVMRCNGYDCDFGFYIYGFRDYSKSCIFQGIHWAPECCGWGGLWLFYDYDYVMVETGSVVVAPSKVVVGPLKVVVDSVVANLWLWLWFDWILMVVGYVQGCGWFRCRQPRCLGFLNLLKRSDESWSKGPHLLQILIKGTASAANFVKGTAPVASGQILRPPSRNPCGRKGKWWPRLSQRNLTNIFERKKIVQSM